MLPATTTSPTEHTTSADWASLGSSIDPFTYLDYSISRLRARPCYVHALPTKFKALISQLQKLIIIQLPNRLICN
jgi:hypothetical protein